MKRFPGFPAAAALGAGLAPARQVIWGVGLGPDGINSAPGAAGGAGLAVVPLPDYEIARLRTGQWSRGRGDLWTADFTPPGDPAAGRRER